METNQTQAQGQPAQLIAPEATQPEQQPTEQPAPVQEQQATQPQPDQPTKPLYNPDEVAQIVKHLTDGYFDPEYILLFGKARRRYAPQRRDGLRPACGRARDTRI